MKQKKEYYFIPTEEPKLSFMINDHEIEVYENEIKVFIKVDDGQKQVMKYKLN